MPRGEEVVRFGANAFTGERLLGLGGDGGLQGVSKVNVGRALSTPLRLPVSNICRIAQLLGAQSNLQVMLNIQGVVCPARSWQRTV